MNKSYRTAVLASVLGLSAVTYPGLALRAQTAAGAAEVITAAGLARHIQALAHDSLQGRVAPSAGLEQAAQYVAAKFEALGLFQLVPPGGGPMSLIQRYPMPGQARIDYVQSRVTFTTSLHRGSAKILSESGDELTRQAEARFNSTARFHGTLMPRYDPEEGRPVVLVAGPQTAASIAQADVRNKIILYVPPAGAGVDTVEQQVVLQTLAAVGHGVVVFRETDSLRFAAALQAASVPVADRFMFDASTAPWVVEVWPGSLRALFAANDIDLAALQGTKVPIVRALPFVRIEYYVRSLDVAPQDSSTKDAQQPVTLPIVMAAVEGSDPALKQEYILLVAHLDQNGRQRGDPARRTNGANDNASGVAALIELAKAFRQPGARPKRSLVFLATTGGGLDFWGSNFFFNDYAPGCVMTITLDMLGQPAGDSVVIEGTRELELAPSPAWVAAAHPELGLTVVDTGTVFRPTADHYVFSRQGVSRGIPSLYIHTGNGAHTAPPARDDAAAVDTAQEARIVQLLYHFTREIGNAKAKPKWNSVGRARVLGEAAP